MVNLHRGAFAASASAWAFTTGLICSLHIASNGATLRITCKMQVTRKGNIAYVLLCCIIALTRSTPRTNRGLRSSVFILLALWFALSFTLGARGVFINLPGTPPLALLAAV